MTNTSFYHAKLTQMHVFADSSEIGSDESVLPACCLSVCRLSVCNVRGLWPDGDR